MSVGSCVKVGVVNGVRLDRNVRLGELISDLAGQNIVSRRYNRGYIYFDGEQLFMMSKAMPTT